MNRSCSTCRWWCPTDKDMEGRALAGQCRVRAPHRGDGQPDQWPVTSPAAWCQLWSNPRRVDAAAPAQQRSKP